jgi:hypothetical protein
MQPLPSGEDGVEVSMGGGSPDLHKSAACGRSGKPIDTREGKALRKIEKKKGMSR